MQSLMKLVTGYTENELLGKMQLNSWLPSQIKRDARIV